MPSLQTQERKVSVEQFLDDEPKRRISVDEFMDDESPAPADSVSASASVGFDAAPEVKPRRVTVEQFMEPQRPRSSVTIKEVDEPEVLTDTRHAIAPPSPNNKFTGGDYRVRVEANDTQEGVRARLLDEAARQAGLPDEQRIDFVSKQLVKNKAAGLGNLVSDEEFRGYKEQGYMPVEFSLRSSPSVIADLQAYQRGSHAITSAPSPGIFRRTKEKVLEHTPGLQSVNTVEGINTATAEESLLQQVGMHVDPSRLSERDRALADVVGTAITAGSMVTGVGALSKMARGRGGLTTLGLEVPERVATVAAPVVSASSKAVEPSKEALSEVARRLLKGRVVTPAPGSKEELAEIGRRILPPRSGSPKNPIPHKFNRGPHAPPPVRKMSRAEETRAILEGEIAPMIGSSTGSVSTAVRVLPKRTATSATVAEVVERAPHTAGTVVKPHIYRLSRGAEAPASTTAPLTRAEHIRRSLDAGVEPVVESASAVGSSAPVKIVPSLIRRAGTQALDLWNATRSVKTSYDVSAPRNSLILSLTRPVHAGRAFVAQVKALRSDEAAARLMREIDIDPVKQLLADPAGLHLTRLDGSLAGREEMFRSAIAEKIPGVRASERAFHTYLNQLRFSVFKDYVLAHPEASAKDLKGVANAINYFTGRGSFGPLEGTKVVEGLTQAFYAPRLTLSYVQSLASPMMGTKAAKKFAARHVAQFVATGLALGGLAKVTSKYTGVDFEFDPRSDDFAKFKIGRHRFNPFGGFSYLARATAQAIAGKAKSAESGEFYDKSWKKTATTFGRTRVHPSIGFIIDLKTGKTIDQRQLFNVDGSPRKLEIARDLLMPISAGEIVDAVAEGDVVGMAFTPLTISGADVRKVAPPKPASDKQRRYVRQLVIQRQLSPDQESMRLFKKGVNELSMDEASKMIEEFKQSKPMQRRRVTVDEFMSSGR